MTTADGEGDRDNVDGALSTLTDLELEAMENLLLEKQSMVRREQRKRRRLNDAGVPADTYVVRNQLAHAEAEVTRLGREVRTGVETIGALRSRASWLEDRLETTEAALARASTAQGRGAALELSVLDVIRAHCRWSFDVRRVGPQLASSMDLELVERDAPSPVVIRVECKQKQSIKSEDVAKFLRDLDATEPDAAVFYTTAPLTRAMRVPLDDDERVVVAEEKADRDSTVLGAVCAAWTRARQRREAARRAAAVADENKWPPCLRPLIQSHLMALLRAAERSDDIGRRVAELRKGLRQGMVEARDAGDRFARANGIERYETATPTAFRAYVARLR